MSGEDDVAVVVIGGGPAGVSAATALVRRGIDALLLERSDGRGNAIGETLAPSVNPLLRRLGLFGALSASHARPSFGNRSSWGSPILPPHDSYLTTHDSRLPSQPLAERDFLRDPHGHGWHLDRPAFNAALLGCATARGVRVWRGARVISCPRRAADGGWRLGVTTRDGTRTVTAAMLLDASGRTSLVSRALGMRRRVFDRQVAAVGTLSPRPHVPIADTATLVEAAERGWWYSAPLPDGTLVVAWFSDPDLLAGDGAWRPDGWSTLLQSSAVTWERVAGHGCRLPASIRVVAAGSSLLPQPAGAAWIAAGDAAAAFDPLSSQGIGSALAAGAQAAEAVVATLAGDEAAFARYTDRMRADFAHYLWLRHAYYADEQRWPEAPFWRRRQRVPSSSARDPLRE